MRSSRKCLKWATPHSPPSLMPVIANNDKKLVFNALGLLQSTAVVASLPTDRRVTVMFTILAVSMIAVSFPAVSRTGIVRIPNILFFIGKHFGTGVILATAFIHLLPDSFSSLLDRSVGEKYGNVGNWVGLIILGSLLTIFLVEYISTTFVDHLHAEPSAPPSPQEAPVPLPVIPSPSLMEEPSTMLPFLSNTPKIIRLRSSIACICQNGVCVCIPGSPTVPTNEEHHHSHHHHEHHQTEKHRIGRRRQIVSIFVLQAGIMIHSLVIGLTLSIASGADFASLTTAIIFHQIFEGLSLGVRIAALPQAKEKKPMEECNDVPVSASTNQLDGLNSLVRPELRGLEGSSPRLELHRENDTSSEAPASSPTLSQKTPLSSRRSSSERSSKGWGRILRRSSSGYHHDHAHYGATSHGGEDPHKSTSSRGWLSSIDPLKLTLLLLFAVTTPAGMVLGLFLWGNGANDAASMKLVQGVMSAVSAGMLIYAATVEMIAGDFVFGDLEGHHNHGPGGHGHEHEHDHEGNPLEQREHHHHHEHSHPSIGKRIVAVTSMLCGVAAMTIIGLWD
ncbi:hypothetical protein NMY22_g16463 [Coprinellus aureogranulatus]|nr:hypothetical protein NMY22_g16463 [Coprinellus aureogranulatus]